MSRENSGYQPSSSNLVVGAGCVGALLGSMLTYLVLGYGAGYFGPDNWFNSWGTFMFAPVVFLILGAPIGFLVGSAVGFVLSWLAGQNTGLSTQRTMSEGRQVVGEKCVLCLKRINSDVEGTFCPTCGSAVHHACVEVAENEHERHCPTCGGDPSLRLAPDYHG